MIIRKKGFTIVELMVVITIIAILATLVSVNVVGATKKSRDAKRKSDLGDLAKTVQMYYENNNQFPYDNPDINKTCLFPYAGYVDSVPPIASDSEHSPGCLEGLSSSVPSENGLVTKGLMATLPADPRHPTMYYLYDVQGTGSSAFAILHASLETYTNVSVGLPGSYRTGDASPFCGSTDPASYCIKIIP